MTSPGREVDLPATVQPRRTGEPSRQGGASWP
jgi:hypothetical protein